jgi:hypothetical protein
MSTTVRVEIPSNAWIASLLHESDDFDVEAADGTTSAELTDTTGAGEVAVHFTLPNDNNALVTIYLTRWGALALSAALAQEATKATP